MSAEVNSAFDIAFYFRDKAATDNIYLQPQKLHGLLFLAQAYYFVVSSDKNLMPAVFVADERGPLEPNVHFAFSNELTNGDTTFILKKEIKMFLESIWRRFGSLDTEKVIKITKNSIAYKTAINRGHRSEISAIDMKRSFKAPNSAIGDANKTKQRTELYRTQSGKPVTLKKWAPSTKLVSQKAIIKRQ